MTDRTPQTQEGAIYARYIVNSLDRMMACLEGMDMAHINWRPPAPDTNSVYALAAHTLGNAEENILRTLCFHGRQRDLRAPRRRHPLPWTW